MLEDQIVDLIIIAMERSEEMADDAAAADDDDDDDDAYNTNCLQLWQHLSSQLIFFVLFQFSSFPHMVNALYEKVRVHYVRSCRVFLCFVVFVRFYAPQLYRQVLLRRVLAMGILSVCLSVRPPVCHGPVQKQPSEIETPGLHHMIA